MKVKKAITEGTKVKTVKKTRATMKKGKKQVKKRSSQAKGRKTK